MIAIGSKSSYSKLRVEYSAASDRLTQKDTSCINRVRAIVTEQSRLGAQNIASLVINYAASGSMTRWYESMSR
jgi:hypothetical protein